MDIYDMSGNVWEWCEDKCSWDDDNRTVVLDNNGDNRVIRGGSWRSASVSAQIYYRNNDVPGNRSYNIGFRLACSSK